MVEITKLKGKKSYYTQWAAQFYTAAQLTCRGYLVSFTLGNAPKTDLLVESINGTTFRVQCKGLSSNTSWITGSVKQKENLYYVFVRVPAKESEEFKAFIMTSEEVAMKVGSEPPYGFSWNTPHPYKDLWNKLPD